MATYTSTINAPTATTQTVADNQSLLVTGTGSIRIAAGNENAVDAGINTSIDILGTVESLFDGNGIEAQGSISVRIGGGGTVSGHTGLYLQGTGQNFVENYGTISGRSRAIDGSGALTLLNKGIIENSTALENSTAIDGSATADTIINEGVIRGGGIFLAEGRDTYYGRNGFVERLIALGADDDRAFGGAGSEYFAGEEGDDIIDGGAGQDTVLIKGVLPDTTATVDLRISGPQDTGEGFDTFISIENVTVLMGNYNLIGNDLENVLAGGRDKDTLDGGGGNDTLFGGFGDDVFNGGSSIDTVTFTAPYMSTFVYGETVGAVVNLAISDAQNTGYGVDRFSSIENLIGTSFGDTFTGNSAANTFTGKGGNDTLDGAGGNDTLVQEVGDGNDRLVGGSGIDTVKFSGTVGATINLALTSAQVTAYGSDILIGIENLSGGSGHDRFTGNSAANTLNGGAGNDTLDGGAGKDVLTGGSGRDTFVFKDPLGSANVNKITDYDKAYDSIQLDNRYMSKLGGAGRLSSSKFVLGTKALDADDCVIYDRSTGKLYYDADGSGAGAQVLIAQFTNKAALAYSEFTII